MSSKYLWLVIDVPESQDPEVTAVAVSREEAVDKMVEEAKESELIRTEGGMREAALRKWLEDHDSYEDCGVRVCCKRIEVPS